MRRTSSPDSKVSDLDFRVHVAAGMGRRDAAVADDFVLGLRARRTKSRGRAGTPSLPGRSLAECVCAGCRVCHEKKKRYIFLCVHLVGGISF